MGGERSSWKRLTREKGESEEEEEKEGDSLRSMVRKEERGGDLEEEFVMESAVRSINGVEVEIRSWSVVTVDTWWLGLRFLCKCRERRKERDGGGDVRGMRLSFGFEKPTRSGERERRAW